jgi:PmbA protein
VTENAKSLTEARAILDLTTGRCDQAEVHIYQRSSTPVNYDNNRLKMIEGVDSQVYALRVIKDGKLGFSTSTRPGGGRDLVEAALAVAAFGTPVDIAFAGPAVPSAPECHDPAVPALDTTKLVSMGQELVDGACALDPNIQTGARIQKGQAEVALATSAGFASVYRDTRFSVFAGIEFIEGQNLLSVWDGYGGTHFCDRISAIKDKIAHDFQLGRRNVEMKSGLYDVIIAPGAVGDILAPILTCVNGRAVERGISPWRGRLGEAMFSPALSIHDDGLAARMPGSGAFDGEGVPMSRKAVVDQGRLSSYLLDLRSAKALGLAPTGNAIRRAGATVPSPGSTNIIVAPGNTPLADMIRGVKEGVWVEQLMGAWAGNMFAGQVSGSIALGFKIENGELTGRVKDCMLSLPVFTALKENLEALSRETRCLMELSTPHLLLSRVSVSTKA